MTTRARMKMRNRKRRDGKTIGDIEIVIRDGFSHRKIDKERGNFERTLKNILGRLDEKLEIAWDKILPERCLDDIAKKKRRERGFPVS